VRARRLAVPVLTALLVLPAPPAHADGEDAETEAPAQDPAGDPDKASQVGTASWYGPGFHGRQTANGEIFDQDAMTAAHRWLPFGTQIVVTNLDNGCSAVLRVTDRGPYHGERILDCSRAGAEALGFIDKGVARIRWDVLAWPKSRKGLRLGLGPPIATSDKPLIRPPKVHEPQTPVALDAF
jgi:rare lipoprotein A (peptidoglycan hydrolase)